MSEHLLKPHLSGRNHTSDLKNSLPMDAVILAGTHRNPKRLIHQKNKAFLELNGRPLVAYVVRACLQSHSINRVVVVGPRNELEAALAGITTEFPERLILVQQRSRILENVWNGFLATFEDGNNLPVNRRIETLLLGGHIPIKKKVHLHIIQSVYASVAGQMERWGKSDLHRGSVVAIMERRFDEFRFRFEQQEWFMGKMGIETLLAQGHILTETGDSVSFRNQELQRYFAEWERRFQKYVFVTGSDIPLMEPAAVDDFVSRCRDYDDDFYIGVSSAHILRHFYQGENGRPGIYRPYLSFREAEVRAANMIIVKPNRVGNKELIQESFGVRKMTEWRNVFAVTWKLLKLSGRFQTLKMLFMLQLTAVLKRRKMKRMAQMIQRLTRASQFEYLLSRIFMTQIRLIESPYGSVSLDIDGKDDFDRLCMHHNYWKEIQNRIIKAVETLPVQEMRPIGCFSDLAESDFS